jgi:hypothetical protein
MKNCNRHFPRPLMFSHLGQHGSDHMPKRVPAGSGDANGLEGRMDLLL